MPAAGLLLSLRVCRPVRCQGCARGWALRRGPRRPSAAPSCPPGSPAELATACWALPLAPSPACPGPASQKVLVTIRDVADMSAAASGTLGPSITLIYPTAAMLCMTGHVQSLLLLSLALHHQGHIQGGSRPMGIAHGCPGEMCKRGLCTSTPTRSVGAPVR